MWNTLQYCVIPTKITTINKHMVRKQVSFFPKKEKKKKESNRCAVRFENDLPTLFVNIEQPTLLLQQNLCKTATQK